MARVEPTQPAQEEQGMPALANLARWGHLSIFKTIRPQQKKGMIFSDIQLPASVTYTLLDWTIINDTFRYLCFQHK